MVYSPFAAFQQVSRRLVTKIPINHENVCDDKKNTQMLQGPTLDS